MGTPPPQDSYSLDLEWGDDIHFVFKFYRWFKCKLLIESHQVAWWSSLENEVKLDVIIAYKWKMTKYLLSESSGKLINSQLGSFAILKTK